MHLVGRPELIDEPWFATGADRARHTDVLDEAARAWIARHPAPTSWRPSRRRRRPSRPSRT
ncbi:hypothetical protein SGLAM104S_02309 [Streptomyces glaucescens]